MDYLKIGKASDLESPEERRIYRALEMFPGILSWGTLILAGFLCFFKPLFVAIFAIGFDLYWFFRAIYLVFHLRAGFKQMRKHEEIDWLNKLTNLHKSTTNDTNEISEISGKLVSIRGWRDIYHLIILPNYKEPLEIIRESLTSILNSDYPKDKMLVVLAFEQRAGKERKTVAEELEKEFKGKFFKFLITWHPANIPGEVVGKGANETWAGKRAKAKIIDPLRIPYENIIVSSFDTDTVVFPKYFSCLTYHYLSCKKPTRTSFQPIPLYTNNIWQAPLISQAFSFSSTFWQIMCQERPEKLITFSSHSMSFKALLDVDWWQTNIVSEDSRIFWQCFLKYDGDYQVQPLYYPVSMDANVAKSFWRTLVNIYRQQRRWAYGVENVFYFLFGFYKDEVKKYRKIPLKKKLSLGFEIIEGQWSWATASIIIFFLGWLPIFLGGEQFSQTLISFNLPKITSRILTFSMMGLIASIYYGISLFPKTPSKKNSFKYLTFALGWFLVPLTMIFLTSLPALDSQTRWMLGKYMGFWPTPKQRPTVKVTKPVSSSGYGYVTSKRNRNGPRNPYR